ncbi:MAG: hypothetical protein J6Q89_04395 [Clostridia bacterium]|nr:hypothetical protein [Clostridia bacterium]
MNTNFEIVNTGTHYVHPTSDRETLVDVQLSIVRENSRYGLLYTPPEREHQHKKRRKLTVPIIYDNLFFEEVNCSSFLIAVIDGMQWLYRLEMLDTEAEDEVIAVKLLSMPCDRISVNKKHSLFHLRNNGKESFYDPCDEDEFLVCDNIEYIDCNYFRGNTENTSVIWDVLLKKTIITLKKEDLCQYVGAYRQGDVFRITGYGDNDESTYQQLLFYSYRGHELFLSPKAERIVLHTKLGSVENQVVGIDMSWGDWDSPVDINEICKERLL